MVDLGFIRQALLKMQDTMEYMRQVQMSSAKYMDSIRLCETEEQDFLLIAR